ncbi:hypothetical protein [Elioraea sp.]|uniref:hypothetical protein n=1 Tax=Elioraea sp. TaxID=2185103 RepID=UPI0025C405B4|nr:hypothetical protein [Elioraea sp.]
MRIPDWLRRALLRRLNAMAARRVADFVIGGEENPYLLRWWVIPRNRWFNVYFHHFRRSDDDRALHDHPWWSISVILHGPGYREHLADGSAPWRRCGAVIARGATAAHRVELLLDEGFELPVWTLFITGPRVREWGFWCPQGWRHWREFTDKTGSRVGRGCE